MKTLDLFDIQGNICKGYGRFSFPTARYLFLTIHHDHSAGIFISKLLPLITTAAPWRTTTSNAGIEKPTSTTNVAFTMAGLAALGLPQRSLEAFPLAFKQGMKKRQTILGDDGPSAPEHWDPIWKTDRIHIWISINATSSDALIERYQAIENLIEQSHGGVSLLSGHRGDNDVILPYQEASALQDENGNYTAKEHFGYTDGIGNPFFEGCGSDPIRVNGRGKLRRDGSWAPLATGEFILGHVDEAEEYPPTPDPKLLSHNGTFMVYRKLHQNVGTYHEYLDQLAKDYPGGKALLKAKFVGRWADNGAPLTLAATEVEKQALDERTTSLASRAQQGDLSAKNELESLRRKWIDFTYDNDVDGAKCPLGAHLRRTNTRGFLEFEKEAFERKGALIDRRRIMRRGLPYGKVSDLTSNNGEHGIIFMALNASIERQFEFVQQQWINYGNDFRLSNDKDIILGSHDLAGRDKAIIQGDRENGTLPFFCAKLPRFVETRGGDYFFIPSITALGLIANGIVDPT